MKDLNLWGMDLSDEDLLLSLAKLSGLRTLSVRCVVAAGLKAGADHRCRAVFADHSHSVWAVKAGAAGAQLLYPIG